MEVEPHQETLAVKFHFDMSELEVKLQSVSAKRCPPHIAINWDVGLTPESNRQLSLVGHSDVRIFSVKAFHFTLVQAILNCGTLFFIFLTAISRSFWLLVERIHYLLRQSLGHDPH